MSRRTCHFGGGVCRGYPTPTQSIAVSHVIIETGRPRGRGTEKEDNNNKAVGQVCALTLSVFFFFERTRANTFHQEVDDWMALAEHKVLKASLRSGSDLISPEDSVSCIGSQAQSSSSKRSKNHSRVSSHGSIAAPVEAARIKEAAKFAELKVEKIMLERRQVLEEKKFRLKQEEARLNLEVEIAKSAAKEHALAGLFPSPSGNLPLRPLEPKPEVKREDVGAPVNKELNYSGCSGESHYVPPCANARREDIMQDNVVFAANPDRFIACDNYQKEALAFERHQTALQVQQNWIVQLLVVNQNKSRLPQPRVPMFNKNPVE